MGNNKKVKKLIFHVLVIILFLPLIQKTFTLIQLKPLHGYFIQPVQPEFKRNSWLAGSFQDSMNIYIENTIGFRPFFIRLNNQINFTFFKKAGAVNTIIGKDKVLFQENYINSLWGNDFVGDSVIYEKAKKLAFIQQKLNEKGKHFLFLIAPGKASFYEEKIPNKYYRKPRSINNYEVCIKAFKENNINFMDMRAWFLNEKYKAKYPIFPRCGTHWSGYAISLVADSLFRYFENISKIKLNKFVVEPGELTSKNIRFTDNDIGEAMNLLWPIKNFQMYYPKIVFNMDKSVKKPAILSIGDSFTQSFFGFYPFFENVFNEQSQYWYYFKVVSWPESLASQYLQVANYDLRSELMKYDFILIVSTEQNLNDIGFGFIEKVYPLLNMEVSDFEAKVQGYIFAIKNSPQWLESVTKKAIENNVEVDEMIRKDAVWMVENEK